ncbi:21683_t:CDS:1, partial [Dentiscutata erythropus]
MNGIGIVTDNQMAIKIFSIAAPYLMKLFNINKEVGTISLTKMLNFISVGKDKKKTYVYSKLVNE